MIKNGSSIHIVNYSEKNTADTPEEMHATLLYTATKGINHTETLYQTKEFLFNGSIIPPSVKRVAITYGKIIQPNWKFKIEEIVISKSNADGKISVAAKLLFNDANEIYYNNHPVSAGLKLTLVVCLDSSILSDQTMTGRLVEDLNKKLKGKFIKTGGKDGVSDLEFWLPSKPWKIRAMKKFRPSVPTK